MITVGAGDKMFWGRLAAWRAGVPVVASALHSTGWPDGVGRLNRLLTPITDAFIAVADAHGEYLVERERFPRRKVCVIPNGVDVERFRTGGERLASRQELGLTPTTPVAGIVAALRPEKNHELFLRAAADGPPAHSRSGISDRRRRSGAARSWRPLAAELGIDQCGPFPGHAVRHSAAALGDGRLCPDVAHRSQPGLDSGSHGHRPAGGRAERRLDRRIGGQRRDGLLDRTRQRRADGPAASANCWRTSSWLVPWAAPGEQVVVDRWSLDAMVHGYEQLISSIYSAKCDRSRIGQPSQAANSQPQTRGRLPSL